MTSPLIEIREQVARAIEDVPRVGRVWNRQHHTTTWEEFADLFGWTDPATEKNWVRGWLVMPSEEVAGVRDQTFGSSGVQLSITSRVLIRGIQSLSEAESQYEDFFESSYAVFLALARKRGYTLSDASCTMVMQPSVRWESYRNRRIGGAACHTAEFVVSYEYEIYQNTLS